MKRMLFNATQAEELRVAIVDGQKLIDLDIESAAKEQRKSNIYKGIVTRVEPSLEAAFVDYGADRHGFLPFKEISRIYFQPGVEASRAKISEAIKEGQELIAQVDKDERGNKGAALTTFVSLAGRHLVLMPNNPRGGGVSRRVDGDERTELREIMDQLEVPSGMSLIARTAAIGRQAEELQWDLNYLLQLWAAIEGAATPQFDEEKRKRTNPAPFLIYLEGSLVIRAIRDYFQPDIGEILIDTPEILEQAQYFMSTVMPGNVNRVKPYNDDVPLFSRFQIEHQIETAFSRQVNLPSGGAIVIDHTEALVAVDVNSGRSTKGADIEETALKTNLEAADEIARQLRLRDLGGLIVIDFIDMESPRAQRDVETRLKEALRHDRARVQMGKISRFGLMELSRQRLRPALAETSYITCPRCTGTGHIRSTESAALHILRILEEEAMKDNTGAVHVQVPVDVATFLLNEKRHDVQAIELRHKVTILLVPNVHMETPAHTITRLRHEDLNQEEPRAPSYKMVEVPPEENTRQVNPDEVGKPRQEAAIKGITPEQPAPIVAPKPGPVVATPQNESPGLIAKIIGWFRAAPATPAAPAPTKASKPREGDRENRRDRDRDRNSRRGRNRREGRDEERTERSEHAERGSKPERSERPARSEKRQNAEAASGENQQQPRERRPRGERRERPQPEERAETAPATTSETLTAQETPRNGNRPEGEEEAGGSRRRGRRGGRNRGERRNEAVVAAEGESAANVDVVVPAMALVAVAETAAPEVVANESLEAFEPVAAAANPAVAADVTAEVPVAPAVILDATATEPSLPVVVEAVTRPIAEMATAAVPVAVAAPQEAPAAVEPEAGETLPAAAVEEVVVAPSVVQPSPVDLDQVLSDSGLVLVQTSGVAPIVVPEVKPALGRPRRRTQHSAAEQEPLVMVETQAPQQ
jgi:ribonuclease E